MPSMIKYKSDNIEALKRYKVYRVMCQDSLMFHYKYFFFENYRRKAAIFDYIKKIVDALERILKGELTRLIINAPPRYFKTEIVVKAFISNGICLNPAAKFIHLSYSDDLALDNSEHIKDTINSDAFQKLFPEIKIKIDSKAKNKWYTTKGGGLLARAAGGSVTGFGAGTVDQEFKLINQLQNDDEDLKQFIGEIDNHYQAHDLEQKWAFGGAIIIDDPIKPEDADSDTVRTRVNDRFDSTIRNRTNSRKTPIIVNMQRLHPQDLSGYLMRKDEADKWEVISLPAIFFDGEGKRHALCPLRHTLEELDALKKANEIVFERQYMQNPNPRTGLMFPMQELQFADFNNKKLIEYLNNPDHNYVCADPADQGGDDFAGLDSRLIGDKIYIANVLYNTDGADHNEQALVKMVLNSKASNVGVESVLGWKETAENVRSELITKGFEGEVRLLRPRTGKLARISNRSSFIKNHFIFREDWEEFPQYAKFMRNLTSYMKIQEPGRMNKHDDAPDVSEMCASYYQINFPSLWPIKE
jgi:predicted phage terminase large subunit-like protein